MKPDVLVIESELTAFALADRRLRDQFHLTWAPSLGAAESMLSRLHFDVVLARADDDAHVGFIARLVHEWPDVPIVAIAPWEVQGDRAVECGAREWVSAPINFPRLAAVLDFVVVDRRREEHHALPSPPRGIHV